MPTNNKQGDAPIIHVIDGNKLIAEYYFGVSDENYPGLHKMKWHDSWNSLINVIASIKARVRLSYDDEMKRRYKAIENELCNLNISGCWYCVVKFIEWYNQTNQQ